MNKCSKALGTSSNGEYCSICNQWHDAEPLKKTRTFKEYLYFKGDPDGGEAYMKHLGLARYYGERREVLLIPVPFNWIVIGYDHAIHFLRRGRVIRCPHCKKAI